MRRSRASTSSSTTDPCCRIPPTACAVRTSSDSDGSVHASTTATTAASRSVLSSTSAPGASCWPPNAMQSSRCATRGASPRRSCTVSRTTSTSRIPGWTSRSPQPERLPEDAPRRRRQRAQVEPHRAVGDPLDVVRELLRHRRLIAAADLREPREPGPNHESLPVGGQLEDELLEEARPDRARPDERHVAAQNVPQLRQLVELRPLQPATDLRVLELGALHELLADVRPGAAL